MEMYQREMEATLNKLLFKLKTQCVGCLCSFVVQKILEIHPSSHAPENSNIFSERLLLSDYSYHEKCYLFLANTKKPQLTVKP